jgi:hypothetical protein
VPRRRTPSWKLDNEPKHPAEDDEMSVSASDLSDTRAEVDSPSGLAATSEALRTGPGHVDDAGSGVPAAGVKRVVDVAGPATGHVAESRAANASMVAETIESSYTRQAAQGVSRSSFLQDTAAKVQAAAEEGTRAGGREHLKGHVIERLGVSTYNAKNGLTGKMLDPRPNSGSPAYDASRNIKGKFAGGVRVIPLLVSFAAAEH